MCSLAGTGHTGDPGNLVVFTLIKEAKRAFSGNSLRESWKGDLIDNGLCSAHAISGVMQKINSIFYTVSMCSDVLSGVLLVVHK